MIEVFCLPHDHMDKINKFYKNVHTVIKKDFTNYAKWSLW